VLAYAFDLIEMDMSALSIRLCVCHTRDPRLNSST